MKKLVLFLIGFFFSFTAASFASKTRRLGSKDTSAENNERIELIRSNLEIYKKYLKYLNAKSSKDSFDEKKKQFENDVIRAMLIHNLADQNLESIKLANTVMKKLWQQKEEEEAESDLTDSTTILLKKTSKKQSAMPFKWG